MLAGVDPKGLRDAVGIGGIGVVPAGLEFDERNLVGGVAIDLVGAHVHKRAFGAGPTGGLEQVECADGVGVEVVKGNGGGPIVGGLGGRMDDRGRLHLRDECQHSIAVTDVEFVVPEAPQARGEPLLVPTGVAGRPEEHGPLVVVDAVHFPAGCIEVGCHLAADEAR